jgi:hypothetical protein
MKRRGVCSDKADALMVLLRDERPTLAPQFAANMDIGPSDSQLPSRGEGCEYPEMGKPKADTVCTWYQVIGRGGRTEYCVCRSDWIRFHVRLVSPHLHSHIHTQ